MSDANSRTDGANPPPANAPEGGFLRASAVNTPRAMLLCATGALVGLGIAGYGLFTAAGTSTHSVPPENVATVNQRPILRSDFITQTEGETGLRFDAVSRADQLKVLDEMVREELLVQRGVELEFPETDQGTRNALVTAITDQAIAEVTTSQTTEQQLQHYYDENRDQWTTQGTMNLRSLVLPKLAGQGADNAMAKARQAAKELRSGTALEQIEQRYGLTEAQLQGDQYYFAVKYRLGDALFAVVSRLSDGDVSDPIAASDGIHIIKMMKNNRPIPLDFAAARAQVLSDYNTAAQTHLLDATAKFLRSRAKILIADDYAGDYRP
jgi:parvulin-like peptidyl-prolyl isomerase